VGTSTRRGLPHSCSVVACENREGGGRGDASGGVDLDPKRDRRRRSLSSGKRPTADSFYTTRCRLSSLPTSNSTVDRASSGVPLRLVPAHVSSLHESWRKETENSCIAANSHHAMFQLPRAIAVQCFTLTSFAARSLWIDLLPRLKTRESDHWIRAVAALRFQPALGGNRRHTGGTLVCLPRRAVARPMRPHRQPCHRRANHRWFATPCGPGTASHDCRSSIDNAGHGLQTVGTNGPAVARPPPEDGGMRSYLYHRYSEIFRYGT